MNEKLELKLVERFPKLLRDYRGSPHETCLAFGIECGDGWNGLIHDTLTRLQKMVECAPDLDIRIAQVKEKFGGLRIYVTMECDDRVVADIVYAILHDAESASSNICEVTGAYGDLCKRGVWYKTLSFDEVNREGSEYADYEPAEGRIKKVWEFRKLNKNP